MENWDQGGSGAGGNRWLRFRFCVIETETSKDKSGWTRLNVYECFFVLPVNGVRDGRVLFRFLSMVKRSEIEKIFRTSNAK